VQNLRLSTFSIVLMTACLAGPAVSLGQEADADKAKALLAQGIAQFNALRFKDAKASLSQVNRDDLSKADRRTLDDYLDTRLDPAIKAQMTAMAAYKDADKAVEAGQLAKAKKGFKIAAASEYLPAAMRQDAEARLAVVTQKLIAAEAVKEEAKTRTVSPVPASSKAATAAPLVAKAPTKANAKAATTVESPSISKAKPAVKPAANKAEAAGLLQDVKDRQAKVKDLIVKGQKALDQNQAERATGYFERALALSPDNAQARRQLNYARSMISTVGGSGIISRMERRRRIARQAADVEFDKAIQQSSDILATADSAAAFDNAEATAMSGRNVLDTYKDLYTEREYNQKLLAVKAQIEQIRLKHEQWAQKTVRQQANEILVQENQRQLRENEERRRKVVQLTNRVKSLRSEGKYDQALETSKQILARDPKNSWAAEQVEMLQQFILTQQERGYHLAQRYNEQKQAVGIRENEIPWWELLRYPRDWKELTVRREPYAAGRGGESSQDRDVRMKLQHVYPTLDLSGEEFERAIDYFRNSANLNIYVKWDSLALEGIDRTKEVTVKLKNVTTKKALNVVLDSVGGVVPLGYVIDGGVITISTKADLSTRTSTRVYDIRDLIVRVPNFDAPEVDLSTSVSTSNNGGGGGFSNNDSSSNDNNENTPSRQELVDNIISMVTETIDPESWPPVGNVGSIRELNGQLVVTQTADNHQALMNLIEQLREARDLLVSIEARFITVNTGFLNSIGVDLDFFFNLGSPLGSTSVIDPFTGATVPTKGGQSGWGSNKPGNNKWTPLAVKQNSMAFTDMAGVGNGIGSEIGAGNSALSLAGTFLDDIQVSFLIQATQAHEATRTLNAPRLTLFNGQQAYFTVGTQQSYVADLDPIVAENAIAYNPIMGVVGSQTSLQVEAVVSADRRYVTLTVYPQIATVNGFSKFAVVTTATDANGNPLTGEGFIQQPNVSFQELQTTVSVPDGGTLLLGGQKLSSATEREMGVPILNKIPILNRGFSNRGSVRDEQTLLILIKPKIIIHNEQEQLQFPN